jgi:hypothetical protein
MMRNISESGIFFETEHAFKPGAHITFAVVLGDPDAGGRFRVECSAKVVRVEPRGVRIGVAARILSYSIEPEE